MIEKNTYSSVSDAAYITITSGKLSTIQLFHFLNYQSCTYIILMDDQGTNGVTLARSMLLLCTLATLSGANHCSI